MNVRQYATGVITVGWLARVLVGALIGLSIATLIAADPVSIPGVGAVNGIAIGVVGLIVGGTLYTQLPDCDCCSGDASCDREQCGPN